MLLCVFCEKECKNNNSHRNHERLCPKNPNRVYRNGFEGKTPWNKGLTKDDDVRIAEHAASVSKTMKGRPSNYVWTDERRQAKSEWRKQYHIDNPEAHPNRKLAGNKKRMTYPEQVAFDYLTEKGVVFEPQQRVLRYYPDFVIGDIIIEIDGARWHNVEHDTKRDLELTGIGYTVHRIDSKENIRQRIDEILGLV